MFDDLSELKEEYSREEIEVLNCNFSNTFIRGWDKSRTLDLICKKIRALLDLEDFIYPKEILIVLRDEGEKGFFVERLNEFLGDEDLVEEMEFMFFNKFINTFAPKNTESGKTKIKHISLKREWKVVFMINPQKIKEVGTLIKILRKLFPEEGAKLFLWEYENYMNTYFILNGFPEAELINLAQINIKKEVKKQPIKTKPKKPKLTETKRKEKERLLTKRKRNYQRIIKEMRREQVAGKSFLNFQIHVEEGESKSLLVETFREIFRNEFETFLTWLEINRLNYIKRNPDDKLFNLVHRWKIYQKNDYRAIKQRQRIYREDFMRIFKDLGFERVLVYDQPKRWEMLREIVNGLKFPKNQHNMGEIIDSRISLFFSIVKREIFVEKPGVKEPILVPLTFRESGKITFLEQKTRVEENSLSKYKAFIDAIARSQNYGLSYLDYAITISPLEDTETKREIMEKIFRNEMGIFLDWFEINKLNYQKKPIPEELLLKIGEWNFYNLKNRQKIIEGQLIYKDNFQNLFIDLGIKSYLVKKYPEKWKILKIIFKNLSFSEGFYEIQEEIKNRIQTLSGDLNHEFFKVVCGTLYPTLSKYVYGSKTKYLKEEKIKNLQVWDKDKEPIVDYENVSEKKLEGFVEKIKEVQICGGSFNDFKIEINDFVEEETIGKYFSLIFFNEFGIFLNWLNIVKHKNINCKIPEELIQEVKKWPNQDEKKIVEIVEGEGKIKNTKKLFKELKIKDYLMASNPDLMAIFTKIIDDKLITKPNKIEKLISDLNTLIFGDSKYIKNDLFVRRRDHIGPPTLSYNSQNQNRKITYIIEQDEREKKEILLKLQGKKPTPKRFVWSSKYANGGNNRSFVDVVNPFVISAVTSLTFFVLLIVLIVSTTRRGW